MISTTDISCINLATPAASVVRLNNITPSRPPLSFLSKFQVNLPMAISALTSGVEPSGLPANFQLSDHDVVCGRGKGSYNRPGNKLFRTIVQNHVDEYLSAKSKLDKSMVLSCIVDRVREQNNGQTRFVKQRPKDKTWYEIGDDLAREKVGHAIREAICARNNNNATALSKKNNKQDNPVVFSNTQETLLAQQQNIFQDMLHTKQANMLIQAQIHQAKNWQEQFQFPPQQQKTHFLS